MTCTIGPEPRRQAAAPGTGGGWSNHPVSLYEEGPVDTINSVGATLLIF